MRLTLNSFRRVTHGKQLLEEIDGLRFLAIFYVVVAHIHGFFWVKTPFFQGEQLSSPFVAMVGQMGRDGKHGVALFFIISGFILSLPFARYHFGQTNKKTGLKDYFVRRLTRLEPPYILALLLLSAVIIVKNIDTVGGIIPHFAASLFYVHNFVYNNVSTILPVAWSLEVEVQFYILAPFLSSVFAIKNRGLRYVILTAGIVLSALVQESAFVQESLAWKLSLVGWLQYFLVGFLLVDLYLNRGKQLKLSPVLQIIGGLVLLYLISFQPYGGGVAQRLLYPTYSFLFFGLVLHFSFWKKVFSIPVISISGGMCYSIYLLHFATISFIGNYTIGYKFSDAIVINYLVQWLIIGAAILVVAGTYFLLVEKPCMRKDWPQQAWAKLTGKKIIVPPTLAQPEIAGMPVVKDHPEQIKQN